jgi:hypothetical protein
MNTLDTAPALDTTPDTLHLRLANIVWDTDGETIEDLPTEGLFEVDACFIEEMVARGLDRDEIIDEVLREDLTLRHGYTLISFDIL